MIKLKSDPSDEDTGEINVTQAFRSTDTTPGVNYFLVFLIKTERTSQKLSVQTVLHG